MTQSMAWYVKMAREWASELGKFPKGYEFLIAKETQAAFAEVEKGRKPDVVLKEMLARIRERIEAANANRQDLRLPGLHVPVRSDPDSGPVGPAAA